MQQEEEARLVRVAGPEHPRTRRDVRPGSLCCFGWIELRDVTLDLLALAALLCPPFCKKSSQRQLVNSVFPKLAMYNSVDPSVAPSLLMLHQQCEDRNVLRYVYYYLAYILSDNGSQGLSAAGGIPMPNWDALADIDAVGGVTRADVVHRIVNQLSAESSSSDVDCMLAFIL